MSAHIAWIIWWSFAAGANAAFALEAKSRGPAIIHVACMVLSGLFVVAHVVGAL